MAATILDGKPVAAAIREQISVEADALRRAGGITPTLAMFRVGEDEALLSHARSVRRSFEKAGFGLQEHALPAETAMPDVAAALHRLNADPGVHGILIQEPLPGHVDQTMLLEILDPLKDVDGVTPLNAGRLAQQRGRYHVASTPAGGLAILDFYQIPLKGQRAVVVGRSDIVGKPMALLLLHRHATVTIAHSRTQALGDVCREADVLVAAVGRAGLITGSMVKPGATAIDFGINFVDGNLVGDVAFQEAVEVAGAITPVPGGTGPATGAILLRNTLQAARWLAE
ncbi:MAG: bifunctional 5,10-methylenetetrahydrofolate dehydrogenase/5,10-methenyltetrahydrofolate cyclohydrolase [Ardenticatenaceae bacterium]|nr:bifunctional 5,10-methylenetetrahydrofolate dehydrogenase/5,10-methenyltetrahydrofolate cyclohydrolase [Ardenticatenaceae bacterium]